MLMAFFGIVCASAQDEPTKRPYACISEDGAVLTFYYSTGSTDPKQTELSIAFDGGWRSRSWNAYSETITSVVFDASFADYVVATTAFWFYGFTNLKDVVGPENLNTEGVDDMYRMFYGCRGLTSLDLSTWNTANVTRTTQMFYDCNNLRTIYVGSLWNMVKVTDSYQMFAFCYSLVGGKGTTYDRDYMDKERACIDGGEEAPGYLTDIVGTGIKGIPANAHADASTAVFDLQGRRVSNPAKGVYLVGERKVAK